MNSSDCENSYVPPCVFVPDEELDGLTNGHDKSNTLDNTSEMNIDTDCIDIYRLYRYRLYRCRLHYLWLY
jgi:hypothetical protein